MAVGTVSTLLLIVLSPTVQIDLLGADEAWFPLRNPALLTVPLSFAVAVSVSLSAPERDARTRFQAIARRIHFGAGE
jgi:cation/acetate symporter